MALTEHERYLLQTAIGEYEASVSIANQIDAGGSSPTWGQITGTLSAQTDLQSALNAKQNTGNYVTALTGDVTAAGPGSSAATVVTVGGSSAVNVNAATVLANAATSANTASAIVRRDASGNFAGSTITINQLNFSSDGAGNIGASSARPDSAFVKDFITSGSNLYSQHSEAPSGQVAVGFTTSTPSYLFPFDRISVWSDYITYTDPELIGAPSIISNNYFNSTNNAGPIISVRRARGSQASPSPVLSGDELGRFQFLGFRAGAVAPGSFAFSEGPYIRSYTTENWDIFARGSELRFGTIANSTGDVSPSDRVKITHDGNFNVLGTGNVLVDGGYQRISGTANNSTTNPNFGAWDLLGLIANNDAQISNIRPQIKMLYYNNIDSDGPTIVLGKARGTQSSPAATSSGDILGRLAFFGYTTGLADGPELRSQATQTWSGSNRGADLYLATTTNNTATPIDRFQITEDGEVKSLTGNLVVNTAGKGLQIKEGSNAKMGTAVLVAGTVTVSTTAVTANSRIFLTSQVDGGTPGFLRVSSRVANTSFTINSSNVLDTSTVSWVLIEPA